MLQMLRVQPLLLMPASGRRYCTKQQLEICPKQVSLLEMPLDCNKPSRGYSLSACMPETLYTAGDCNEQLPIPQACGRCGEYQTRKGRTVVSAQMARCREGG